MSEIGRICLTYNGKVFIDFKLFYFYIGVSKDELLKCTNKDVKRFRNGVSPVLKYDTIVFY